MSNGLDLGIGGLSDYHVVGRSRFATVYSAVEVQHRQRIAVKVLDAFDEAGWHRYQHEQRGLGRVAAHPNIVTPFAYGFTRPDSKLYLTMPYFPGGSLQQLLEERGRLSVGDATSLILSVADALGHSHLAGVAHNAVKPSNLLLADGGGAKLTDFGITALRAALSTAAVLPLPYAPPEMFEPGVHTGNGLDARSDLYSLAATLYALVAGRAPFDGAVDPSPAAQVARIRHEPVPSTGYPALDAFLAVALAKDPANRYQSPVQFSDALIGAQQASTPSQLVAPSAVRLQPASPVGGPTSVSGGPGAPPGEPGISVIGTAPAHRPPTSGPAKRALFGLPAVAVAVTVAAAVLAGSVMSRIGGQQDDATGTEAVSTGAATDGGAAEEPASPSTESSQPPVAAEAVVPDDSEADAGDEVPDLPLEEIDLTGIEIAVGSKDYTTQFVLGEMLVATYQAFGATVTSEVGLGGTLANREALLDGSIDVYPEYYSVGWSVHLLREVEAVMGPDGNFDTEALTVAVAEADLQENGVRWLGYSPFSDAYGFVTGPDRLDGGQPFTMQSMADHLSANEDAVVCMLPTIESDPYGFALFEDFTGYEVPETQMELIEDSNDVYDRVVAGDCTFGGVLVVDGRIPELSLNRVEDSGIMLPYNVSFTMSDELYQQAPAEFEKLAGVVLDPLDLATMTELTRQVDRMGVPEAAVAEAFLVDQGLIG